MTIFSPHTVGRVATRRSTVPPPDGTDRRPSCGIRRSAMSMSAMILSRLVTPAVMVRGERMTSCSTPSMRNRTRRSFSVGSMWMSEARSEIACEISRLTNFTIGASSTTAVASAVGARCSGTREGEVELVHLGVAAVVAVDRGQDVGPRRDDRRDLHAGHEADVVEREDVGRVGHRDDEPAVLERRSAGCCAAGTPPPTPGPRRRRR